MKTALLVIDMQRERGRRRDAGRNRANPHAEDRLTRN